MPTSNEQLPQLNLQQPHIAGDIQIFPSGQISYLAPLPLPTGHPPQDYGHAVGELNDTYLDFGVGLPHVFGWQVTVGLPFMCWIIVVFGIPLFIAFGTPFLGGSLSDAYELGLGVFNEAIGIGTLAASGFLMMSLLIWISRYNQRQNVIPARFNRQRRELCVVPDGVGEPIFVPWESVSAWVMQAQGATQYGVQRQYGMGVGFYHAETDTRLGLEFPCAGLPLAISNWEAIRAYMEYEVHTLKQIQDPLDLQGPGDPPHEGLHTFRNARKRIHQRFRAGEVGWIHLVAWYLFHLMTLWSLPARLTEWEIGKIKQMQRKALPEAMEQWSQPLPKEQWAKPSAELLRKSELVEQLRKRDPQRSIIEIFAAVQATTSRV